MSSTDIAAWWGAVVATLVMLWDIYKTLMAGPRVRLTVGTNMIMISDLARTETKHVTVRAVNTGDAATTITNLGFVYYAGWLRRLLRRPTHSFVVSTPGTPHQPPYLLAPGDIWDGAAIQDKDLERMIRDGHLIIHVYHSHGGPVRRRARFR